MASIGCAGLGVAGQGGDSVIRITQDAIQESVGFSGNESIVETISQSVTVQVT